LASIVAWCRLSPRRSRTITSKVNPLPGQGVTVTEGSLISYIHGGLSRPSHNTLKTNRDDKLLAAQVKSYRRSSGSATPVARVHKDQRWLRVVYVSKFGSRVGGDFLFLLGTNSTGARFRVRDPGKGWRPDAPPRRDHVVAPKPA
jgi:hypothetical protein